MLATDEATNCILISAGGLRITDSLRNLIVADGHVTVNSLCDSIVIARGDVEIREEIKNSIVFCSGKWHQRRIKQEGSLIRDGIAEPLGFKWFEASELGIETKKALDYVYVTKLDPQKPFAKAGFKINDRVTSISGVRVRNAEEFRRAVIRGIIEGKAVFDVERDDAPRDETRQSITVPLKLLK